MREQARAGTRGVMLASARVTRHFTHNRARKAYLEVVGDAEGHGVHRLQKWTRKLMPPAEQEANEEGRCGLHVHNSVATAGVNGG